MGRKPFKKAHHDSFVHLKTEEEIEDIKRIYYIQGKPILALNERIANEIYMRNYNKTKGGLIMENEIIKEIRRVGCVLVFWSIFVMGFLSVITNMSIGKIQEQNQQIIEQNQQIIELLQQDKLEE